MRQVDVDIGRMMKPSPAGRSTLSRVRRIGAVIPGRADGHGLEAAQLDATVAAIARTHVSRPMVKLGARDRAQLVVVAYQTGLVSPGPPA